MGRLWPSLCLRYEVRLSFLSLRAGSVSYLDVLYPGVTALSVVCNRLYILRGDGTGPCSFVESQENFCDSQRLFEVDSNDCKPLYSMAVYASCVAS